MIKEAVRLIGRVHIAVTGPDGRVKEVRDVDNLVVNAGLAFIASRMISAADSVMSHMAIGTGATAPAGGNTGLGAEAGRVALSSSGAAGAVVTYAATFPPGTGTGAITEAGIFNDGSSGTMLNRVTFPVVNKQAGDAMSITWTVTGT